MEIGHQKIHEEGEAREIRNAICFFFFFAVLIK